MLFIIIMHNRREWCIIDDFVCAALRLFAKSLRTFTCHKCISCHEISCAFCLIENSQNKLGEKHMWQI